MSDLYSELKGSIVDGLTNRTLTTCYRWASRRRVMGGDFKGPYSAKFHPWVVGMHDSTAPFNCSLKGAQLGVTEVVINVAFFTLDVKKRDVLYVLPTATTAMDFSKARFGGALSLSPYLRSMFSDINAAGIKQAGANTLYIRGSRGESNLVSIPVSCLILDEVDRMEQDEIWNAIERMSGQLTTQMWAISTPTIPKNNIDLLWQESTQEIYTFRCPSCSKFIDLEWPRNVVICGEALNDPKIVDSYLKCHLCEGKLPHEDKPEFLRADKAIWVPTAANADMLKRGFHVNQLYSCTQSPPKLVEKYFRSFGSEIAEKEFYNNTIGRPFIGDGAKISDDMIANAVQNYSKDDPRPDVMGRFITMGVDQGRWNYVEVTEWFFDQMGLDLNVHARAKVLYAGCFLDEHFHPMLDSLMREWQVLAAVIDWQPNTMDARRFARRYPGHVWLCQYSRGATAKEITIADDEHGAPVIKVDRSTWMSAALGRFKSKPTRIHLPRDIGTDYCEHIKSPVATYVRDDHGNPELDFVKQGDDHFAHARTYSEIALPLVAMKSTNQDIGRFL